MEQGTGKGARLIDDIRRDALAEADQILEAARREIGERERQGAEKTAAAATEAERAAAAQLESVKRTLDAAFAVEMRRLTLRARDQALKTVLERAEAKIARLMEKPEYREFLLSLIVEAAIGLGADRVAVNASPAELALIDQALLDEARSRVKELVLRDVTLSKSGATPLLLQGVVLSADDGRTAYNNQIRTRLARRQAAIRKLIYERLGMQA